MYICDVKTNGLHAWWMLSAWETIYTTFHCINKHNGLCICHSLLICITHFVMEPKAITVHMMLRELYAAASMSSDDVHACVCMLLPL